MTIVKTRNDHCDNYDDDDVGKCGEVTYEVVEGSDSQKPGRIISCSSRGGGRLNLMMMVTIIMRRVAKNSAQQGCIKMDKV